MSGHSKWANIQHRKKSQDARKEKLFTRLLREVTVASQRCDGDMNASRLRLAVDKAMSSNIPKDTIQRAIKKASGEYGEARIEEARYEGYGPHGVAILLECMTNNRNRTVADIRYAFAKYGGNLGTEGAVSYLFDSVGQISYAAGCDEDAIIEGALEAGAVDVITNADGTIDVLSAASDFALVQKRLIATGLEPRHAALTLRANTQVTLEAIDAAASALRLLEALDDLDDVQQLYSNLRIPAAVTTQLEQLE